MNRKLARTVALISLILLPMTTAMAGGAPFLWRVFGARAPHYLAGSVHLAPDTDELPAGLEDAYDQSYGVVFESDLTALQSKSAQQQLVLQGRADAGGLTAEIGAKDFAHVQGQLRKLNLPSNLCDQMHAWFCGLMAEIAVWRQLGFDGATGVDEQLYDDAQEDGKKIRWFEAPQVQLALFSGMSPAVAREFLNASLDENSDPAQSPQALYRAWRNNDTAAIEKAVVEMRRDYPQVYERLLLNRNRSWMPQLERMLGEAQTQMIVVGAAHLVGPDGLVTQLRAKGYTVTPVFSVVPTQAASIDESRRLLAAR